MESFRIEPAQQSCLCFVIEAHTHTLVFDGTRDECLEFVRRITEVN